MPFVVGKGAWSLKSGRGEFKTQCFMTCMSLNFSGLDVFIHKNGCCSDALVGSRYEVKRELMGNISAYFSLLSVLKGVH